MPTREELERERIEREKAEVVARNTALNGEYTFSLANDAEIIDADFTVKEPIVERVETPVDEIVIDANSAPVAKVEPASRKDQYIDDIANKKMTAFLEEDKTESESDLAQIKNEHPNDYEEYIESLRNSEYYKECLAKWQKYYADKREEFEGEAKKEVEATELQARLDARPEVEKVVAEESEEEAEEVEINVEESAENFEKPIVDNSAPLTNKRERKATSIKMIADEDLKNTIEQILLVNLQDAIDENRDFYDAEQRDMLASKRINPIWKEVIGTRADFAKALVQSYAKTFDLTENKTVRNPYPRTIRAMQSNIKAKKGNMDIETIADVVMDSYYNYDLAAKTATGIIPDLAEHLAIQVQEKLIEMGQSNFNLTKAAAEKMLEEIAEEADYTARIAEENAQNVKYLQYAKTIEEMYTKLNTELSKGENVSLSYREVNKLVAELKTIAEVGSVADEMMCDSLTNALNNLKVLAVEAQKAISGKNQVQKDKIAKSIREEKSVIRGLISPETKIDEKSSKNYLTKNVDKKRGTRPIIDKMIMESTKRVGASRSLGKLNEFELSQEIIEQDTQMLLDYVNKNRSASIDVNYELLMFMNVALHDIREKFKDDTQKYDRTQDLMNEVNDIMEEIDSYEGKELPKEMQKSLTYVFNEFIDLSQMTKKGERRLKTDLEKPMEKIA